MIEGIPEMIFKGSGKTTISKEWLELERNKIMEDIPWIKLIGPPSSIKSDPWEFLGGINGDPIVPTREIEFKDEECKDAPEKFSDSDQAESDRQRQAEDQVGGPAVGPGD